MLNAKSRSGAIQRFFAKSLPKYIKQKALKKKNRKENRCDECLDVVDVTNCEFMAIRADLEYQISNYLQPPKLLCKYYTYVSKLHLNIECCLTKRIIKILICPKCFSSKADPSFIYKIMHFLHS